MRWHCLSLLALCLLLARPAATDADNPAATDEQMLRAAGFPTDGPGLLQLLGKRASEDADEKRLPRLIEQLGDDDFNLREQALRRLIAIGARARPLLQQALNSDDPEIARRARTCLLRIKEGSTRTVMAAAMRVLAARRPPGTIEALLSYAPSAEAEDAGDALRQALTQLARSDDGKPPRVLVAALKDRQIARRTAAGLALAAVGYKEAVPPLIELLDQLPLEQTEPIDLLLERLAGDQLPILPDLVDDAARRTYRQTWQAWWKKNEARIRPAQLEQAVHLRGYTLVVLLDKGEVIDLDENNKERWKVSGLEFPLDAQLLPGDERILVAEHNADRVTERDRTGKVVWKKEVSGPLAAQRLPSGNTFIATRNSLIEVDRTGAEVLSYARPDGASFMKAQKLRNGDIACVVLLGGARYVRLRPDGDKLHEVKSFGVDLRTSGGRIDVLPNGNVLIPEKDSNLVVELDEEGQPVRRIEVEEPVAAVHVPGGKVLVTSMSRNRAVELTHSGKEVWEFKSTTRVTRAFRR
jgi:hypothetical protein